MVTAGANIIVTNVHIIINGQGPFVPLLLLSLATGAAYKGLIQAPEAPFTRLILSTRNLDKAFVQTQVMSNRVLPGRLCCRVVKVVLFDPAINLTQRQFIIWIRLDGLGDEG